MWHGQTQYHTWQVDWMEPGAVKADVLTLPWSETFTEVAVFRCLECQGTLLLLNFEEDIRQGHFIQSFIFGSIITITITMHTWPLLLLWNRIFPSFLRFFWVPSSSMLMFCNSFAYPVKAHCFQCTLHTGHASHYLKPEASRKWS